MNRLLKRDILLRFYNNTLFDSKLGSNINYYYNIGSLLGVGILIQILTGIWLSLYYISLLDKGFDSISNIVQEVRYGFILRYIHVLGVSYIFTLIYLHIYKGLYYGSYNKWKVWYIGILLNILLIVVSFLGYSIVGGQQSYWGIVVICNILSVIPYLSNWIITYIWSNYNINNDTINRLFSFHYLLGLLMLVLILIHIIYLHEVGGSNRLGISNSSDLITFNVYFTIKDITTIIIYLWLLLILVYYSPSLLSDNDNNNIYNSMITPVSIVPHWYLLGYYCILRSYTTKWIGVLMMFISILLLLILPLNNTNIVRSSRYKVYNKEILSLYIINNILLIFIGGLAVNRLGIILGKILSILNILIVTIIIPIIGIIENSILFCTFPYYI